VRLPNLLRQIVVATPTASGKPVQARQGDVADLPMDRGKL